MPISYMYNLLKSIQKRVQSTVIILSQKNCLGVPLQNALKHCVQKNFLSTAKKTLKVFNPFLKKTYKIMQI